MLFSSFALQLQLYTKRNMGFSKAMYLGSMIEMRTTTKGIGLFVPDGHVIGKWVLLGPFVGTLMATSRVKEKEKEYTLMATPDGGWSLYAPPDSCVLARINEPSQTEVANCFLVCFAVVDATGATEHEGDDKYLLWVVTSQEVRGWAELTMRYNNTHYSRNYEPGEYPRGLPPNAADMRALVRKYCTQTGINYSDLANAHGAMDSD